jgi:hypothetical protein
MQALTQALEDLSPSALSDVIDVATAMQPLLEELDEIETALEDHSVVPAAWLAQKAAKATYWAEGTGDPEAMTKNREEFERESAHVRHIYKTRRRELRAALEVAVRPASAELAVPIQAAAQALADDASAFATLWGTIDETPAQAVFAGTIAAGLVAQSEGRPGGIETVFGKRVTVFPVDYNAIVQLIRDLEPTT